MDNDGTPEIVVVDSSDDWETTRDLLRNLEEPLLIRGYFSERTHPLLAPLVPNVRDMLREYEIASGGKIEVEIIDVRSLLPFDIHGRIIESLKKTSRVLFVDEDVPGGTTAYMLQEVIEKQGGYYWLDSPPKTLTGTQHRPAYGSDGDYWSKPNAETIFDAVYEMMHEVDPATYPSLR